MRHREY